MDEIVPGFIHFSGTTTFSRKYKCDQGVITIRYKIKHDALAPRLIIDDLAKYFGTVRIEVKPKNLTENPFSLTLSVSAACDFVGGEMPTTETYEAFCRKVRERKAYPPAKVPIPCEGGKSLTAQGQTKKPGSHSQDKHK